MLEAMQHFIRVVESGSFSQAGKVLSKNPSSVTRQIDKLELELGVRLFNRSTRRIELTLAGQRFYQQCLDILSAVQTAKDSLQPQIGEIHGTVALSVFGSFGRIQITPLLPEFCRRYPHINVSLSLDNQIIDFHTSHFDLAIRYGTPVDSNLIMKPLGKDKMALVASPEYIQTHPQIHHPEDVRQHNCLTLHRPRQLTYWYFRKDSNTDQTPLKIKVKGNLSSCGGEPIMTWAQEGEGITLLSRWAIHEDLQEGRLIELLPDWQCGLTEANTASVYMVWTANTIQNPAVRCLIDFLSEKFQPL